MTTTTEESQPFSSLSALQKASDQLIQSLPEDDSPDAVVGTAEAASRIAQFINQAIATGAVLDAQGDRMAAQALIDFWITKSYALSRSDRGYRRRTAKANVLKEFNQENVDSSADRGDAFLATLDEKERNIALRLLFRLIRFPESGVDVSTVAESRAELRKLGKRGQIDQLLNGLAEAGILRIADDSDLVGFSYPALTRQWKWLAEEIRERMRFRERAQSWVASGRSSGALLGWILTWRYRKYSNLNEWEQEFYSRSALLGALTVGAGVVLTTVVILMSANYGAFYETYLAPDRVPRITRETVDNSTPIWKRVENIRWLAANRQRIEVPSVDLAGDEAKDLSGLFTSGAIFANSKLTAVNFKTATLGGASFNDSVIERSSFQDAYLYRAIFDGAEFCKNVNFTGADVLYASFRRVKFLEPPIFAKAAWWQAFGWNLDQVELLGRRYPNTGIEEATRFKFELNRIKSRLDQAKTPLDRAKVLNERAWTLAVYGMVSDRPALSQSIEGLDAKSSIKEAIQLIGDNADLKPGFDDTLAYILMQQDEKNFAEAEGLLKNAAVNGDGEVLFRYAIALHAVGKESEAIENLKKALTDKQYDPSHELYLLGRHLKKDDFKKRIMEMTGRSVQSGPTKCPKPAPAG